MTTYWPAPGALAAHADGEAAACISARLVTRGARQSVAAMRTSAPTGVIRVGPAGRESRGLAGARDAAPGRPGCTSAAGTSGPSRL